MDSLQHKVETLIASQLRSWETVRENYAAMAHIQSKTVDFGRFRMEVQFNPERARSTTAPTGNIKRPCFLCASNRPAEQQTVRWKDYDILVNPYPIFNPHLTIPAINHTPQLLTGRLGDMMELASKLPDFVLLFNGARSGASAPDHFHFQAVAKGVLPAQTELPEWGRRSTFHESWDFSVWAANDYLRPAIVIEGKTTAETAQTGEHILACLKDIMQEPDEAQVNAMAWQDTEKYTLIFFLRTAHRPRQFYAEGAEQFLFSPGAVDMAGVMITVRDPDYQRADVPLMNDLYAQVVPGTASLEHIKSELTLCLARNRK